MSDRFDELVGDVGDPRERERLRRVHELLLSVDAPPERSPTLGDAAPPSPAPLLPRRRGRALVLLAAALAAASFGVGWLTGARGGDVQPEQVIAMSGHRRNRVDRAAASGRCGQLADERARPRARAEPSTAPTSTSSG